MTFNYEEVTPQIKRPIIPVLLRSDTHFIFYRALIDSGADYCILSKDLANLLSIKLSFRNKIGFRGIGRDEIIGFWDEITIKIGEITYTTKVIFAEISDFGHGILGQLGFFDHFDVSLSYENQIIDIQPVKLKN